VRKGYWKADARTVSTLTNEYASSVAKHGPSGGERTTANAALDAFVRKNLNAPGSQTILAGYVKALDRATAPSGNTAIVAGQKLVRETAAAQPAAVARNSALGVTGMAVLAAMIWFGFRRRPQT
jgi:cobalamin biosynthesis Mg chelatase CobN